MLLPSIQLLSIHLVGVSRSSWVGMPTSVLFAGAFQARFGTLVLLTEELILFKIHTTLHT